MLILQVHTNLLPTRIVEFSLPLKIPMPFLELNILRQTASLSIYPLKFIATKNIQFSQRLHRIKRSHRYKSVEITAELLFYQSY